MKFLPTFVLVVTAAQERRERNVDEALTRYRATHGTPDSQTMSGPETTRERVHGAADTVRDETHRAAKSVRGFTHRQAEKARDFGDRQNARYGTNTKPNTDPQDGVHK